MMPTMTSALASDRVATVLERLHAKARVEDPQAKQRVQEREAELGARLAPPQRYELYGDAPLAIAPEVGELYYLLATTRRASRIVEFGTSHGISTIYLACAIRDLGGGGTLIATEILPAKAQAARRNLADAGLDGLVEIRIGDARDTLRDPAAPVDILVLDGRNDLYIPILELVEPHLAPNALVIADLGQDDPDLHAPATPPRTRARLPLDHVAARLWHRTERPHPPAATHLTANARPSRAASGGHGCAGRHDGGRHGRSAMRSRRPRCTPTVCPVS
jgi:predicted O-methyltransferase YrrM